MITDIRTHRWLAVAAVATIAAVVAISLATGCGGPSEADRYCAKHAEGPYFGRQACLNAYHLGEKMRDAALAKIATGAAQNP